MHDIAFYEVFSEEEAALRRHLPLHRNALFVKHTIQEHKPSSLPAALISIRTQSKIPSKWASQIKGIFTRSTGYEHLLEYYRRTKTQAACGYLPAYCSRAVAEQAVLMLMALWRNLSLQQKSFNQFKRDHLTGEECLGKNLLVVGVGHIGGEIVDIGRGLGMTVKGVDIEPKRRDVEYVTLSFGIRWADAVVCALSLTEKTRNMFHYRFFTKARKGLMFINVARGEISPIKDMQKLLQEHILGGLALDVYEQEAELAVFLRKGGRPGNSFIRNINKLKRMENVIFTPHNAFNTRQSLDRKARVSIEALEEFLKHKKFPNIVPGTR